MSKESLVHPAPNNSGLTESEQFWVDHQPFLLARGYKLRPRYDPNWVPSWTLPRKKPILAMDCEDSVSNMTGKIIDAIRILDGLKVAIKLVYTARQEIPIALYLSSDALRSDHRNHNVPILDVILLPHNDEQALLVMPHLRVFDDPPFKRMDEFIEAVRQFLNGLELMHDHRIAHRDACLLNLMMDTTKLIPHGFHHGSPWTSDGIWAPVKSRSRSSILVRPMKYYFIDYGLSVWFSGNEPFLCFGRSSADKTVPELSDTIPYDPFKVDIYQLGNMIKTDIIKEYRGLDVFLPLCEAMTQQCPDERPTASEALQQFEVIVSSMSWWRRHSRVWHYEDEGGERIYRWRKAIGIPCFL